MLTVYRLSKSKFANDHSGEGAKVFGGRWNTPGIPCIYASASRALCLCEVLVNTTKEEISTFSYSIIEYKINIEHWKKIEIASLPNHWQSIPAGEFTKNIGNQYIENLIFEVPSTIIKEESNFIINPFHIDFNTNIEYKEFKFDLDFRFTK